MSIYYFIIIYVAKMVINSVIIERFTLFSTSLSALKNIQVYVFLLKFQELGRKIVVDLNVYEFSEYSVFYL